jgi:hypothetical protein
MSAVVPASAVADLLAALNRELAPHGVSFADAIARLDLGDAEGGIASAIETAEEVSCQISDAILDAEQEALKTAAMAMEAIARNVGLKAPPSVAIELSAAIAETLQQFNRLITRLGAAP